MHLLNNTSQPEAPNICIASLTKGILSSNVTNLLFKCLKSVTILGIPVNFLGINIIGILYELIPFLRNNLLSFLSLLLPFHGVVSFNSSSTSILGHKPISSLRENADLYFKRTLYNCSFSFLGLNH